MRKKRRWFTLRDSRKFLIDVSIFYRVFKTRVSKQAGHFGSSNQHVRNKLGLLELRTLPAADAVRVLQNILKSLNFYDPDIRHRTHVMFDFTLLIFPNRPRIISRRRSDKIIPHIRFVSFINIYEMKERLLKTFVYCLV